MSALRNDLTTEFGADVADRVLRFLDRRTEWRGETRPFRTVVRRDEDRSWIHPTLEGTEPGVAVRVVRG